MTRKATSPSSCGSPLGAAEDSPLPATGFGPRREKEGSALRRDAFGGGASTGNRGRNPGPLRRLWAHPAHLGGTGGVGPAALRHRRSPESLRAGRTTAHAARATHPRFGVSGMLAEGHRTRPDGASAPDERARTRGNPTALRRWRRTPNLTAPFRRGSQAAAPGERRSHSVAQRSPFSGRTMPGGKADRPGLAPERSPDHRGPT
jgi:hypothetical protein